MRFFEIETLVNDCNRYLSEGLSCVCAESLININQVGSFQLTITVAEFNKDLLKDENLLMNRE